MVQSWPQIGVVVAHAQVSTFRDDVRAAGGNAVESVGASRTVAVSEGTPEGVQSPWGHGASGYKKGAKKAANGDVGSEPTVAAADDPREAEQWDMKMIKADQAHKITDGNRNVLVGVLDSGIDADHPDLAANIDVADSVNCTDAGRPDTSATGWQPTTSDHGTHVAGTIAAARNGVGIVGVAPNVRMASVKVVNDAGFIYPEYAVCGFVWAGLTHMDVTNNSYYVDPFEFYCEDQPDQYAAKEAVRRAVAWSTDQGVVHAAAAGNSAYDLADKTTSTTRRARTTSRRRSWTARSTAAARTSRPSSTGSSPSPRCRACPPGSQNSRLSGFSNRGLGKIDVAAPGSTILSTIVAEQRLRHQERYVDGVAARRRRARADEVGAPDVDAGADDREAALAGRRQGLWRRPPAGAPCVGPAAENSFFGEGVVDALDAVS